MRPSGGTFVMRSVATVDEGRGTRQKVRPVRPAARRRGGERADASIRVAVVDDAAPRVGPDGVLGWRLLRERLSTATTRTAADPRYAVLVLDLDRFRTVNDSLGHSVGDQLLIAVAARLSEAVEEPDTLGHLGGDEFAVLMDSCDDAAQAQAEARRIQQAFRSPFQIDGHELFAGLSVGIALGSSDYPTPEACLRDADTAMYLGKASGGSGCLVFDQTMRTRLVEEHRLENDLPASLISVVPFWRLWGEFRPPGMAGTHAVFPIQRLNVEWPRTIRLSQEKAVGDEISCFQCPRDRSGSEHAHVYGLWATI